MAHNRARLTVQTPQDGEKVYIVDLTDRTKVGKLRDRLIMFFTMQVDYSIEFWTESREKETDPFGEL